MSLSASTKLRRKEASHPESSNHAINLAVDNISTLYSATIPRNLALVANWNGVSRGQLFWRLLQDRTISRSSTVLNGHFYETFAIGDPFLGKYRRITENGCSGILALHQLIPASQSLLRFLIEFQCNLQLQPTRILPFKTAKP